MKLENVKDSIDNFFDNLTNDELANICIDELGATELKDLGEQKLKINFKKKVVEKFEGFAIEFKNNEGLTCIYLPSIQVMSEGVDLAKAKLNLDEAVESYFKELMKLSEFIINRKLESMGWTKVKFFDKKLRHLQPLNIKEVKTKFNLSDKTDFNSLRVAV